MYREWATHREADQLCPDCWEGRLVQSNRVLVCPKCGTLHTAGWYRGFLSPTRPESIFGLQVGQGPLFASLQKAASPEGLNHLHLMDFALDLDYPSLDQAVEAAQHYADLLKGEPFRLYFSGSKGFHLVVPAEALGMRPQREPEKVLRAMARALAHPKYPLDTSAYSRRRLFRAANTRHGTTGLYKVALSPEEIPYALELARTPRPVPRLKGRSTLLAALYQEKLAEPEPEPETDDYVFRFTPPCFQRLLEEGPPEPGTRHALTLQLAAFFVRSGRTKEELVAWAASNPGASRASYRERTSDAARAYDWAEAKRPRFSCRVMEGFGLCHDSCPLKKKLV
ncbi:hypothetical protein [Thermus phage P23-45]|uniref:Eukaryotic type DNA primase small subunit n=1 Tax=Thermus virus P23-45 TaxID=2914006 RepID=A7XX66_BP234|nr:primase [Thermus phage P23-45]ABU96873.1 eukaryotic type DNA primase small subunit [Thermus phage P23-45]UYB98434.1 hypothetical protein [Thermus phage P23-45]